MKKFLIILFFINFIFAGFLVKEFSFSEDGLKIVEVDNYHLINLEGCDAKLEEIGKPIIPFKNINILIPPSAEIISVEILELERKGIFGDYYLYPAQMPRPISEYGKEYPFIIDEEFYETEEEYPKEVYKIIPSGNKSGFRIGGIFLFPLHYIPKERRLILYSKIRIKINYEEGKYNIISLTKKQREVFSQDVKCLVINPEDIERFSPPIRVGDNSEIDYVILTDTNLVSAFIPLRDWIRKTGLWTEIRTTQWVNSNYQGRDLPERIRNFIKDYFNNQGLKYVLLGGDGDYNNPIVPTRQAGPLFYASRSWFIASDVYYADLDWSWDGNNNNLFGEWTRADTVDLYYDIYIGRLLVENVSHVNNFIDKLFRYLKRPDTTYQKKLLLPACLLWLRYNHMQSQDSIANLSPTGWIDRVLNQGTNTQRRYEVRDSIDQKFHFVHLVAHGNYEGSWIQDTVPPYPTAPQYHRNDCGEQINTNALCIINAVSCMVGAFDSATSPSCLAESALNAPNSAIGAIMNTRFGWGSGTPYMGPSENLSVRFYEHFFIRDSVRFASCHQSSKERYRNKALDSLTWRWCYYELTLFGEPSMLIWKEYPQRMVVYFPRQIYTGNQVFSCTVKTITGMPIQSAYVTLWKGSEIYQTGSTNANGVVSFNINPQTLGYLSLTVIRPNYLPYEDSVRVVTSQPPGTRIWGPRQLTNTPSSAGLYGICYVPNLNRVYITHFQARNIYIYSSDSLLTPLGTLPTPNNESAIVDIKYCAYDNTFWVHSNQTKRIYKISPTGAVLRYFNSPAQDYPTGLAWDEENRVLYVADRRALNTLPQYIYLCDTLGNVIRQMTHPLSGNAGPRCLALDLSNTNPNRPTLLNVYTSFNSGGTAIDSCGVYELNPSNLTIFQRFLIPERYNVRGIEFDPRDYSYWVTLMELQAGGPYNYVIKYQGFYTFVPIEEEMIGIEKIRANTILFNESFIRENKGILYNQFGRAIKKDNLNKMPRGIYFLKIKEKWYKVIKL